MTSPVQQAGYYVGQKFILTEDDSCYSRWKKGTVITLKRDDQTDVPYFYRGDDESDSNYVPLCCVKPHSPVGLTFSNERQVIETEVTVIRVHRKLTPDEQAAVAHVLGMDG